MSIDLNNTRTLLAVLEQSYTPSTLFRDTFFPNERTFVTPEVDMEYRKGGREMAPFIVPGTRGVNTARGGFTTKSYKPPMMKPKRIVTADDLNKRAFGENLYSQRTPAQREAEIMAKDLADLTDMNVRRMEWMCAQVLLNGKFDAAGYADDGELTLVDTITFSDWTQKETLSGSDTWDNASADIYGDLKSISQKISRNAGMHPTIAIFPYNVEDYLLKNTDIMKWLTVPNSQNLTLMSLQPRIVSPGVRRIGYIQSLDLELYAYDGIYTDSTGQIQQYIPDDHVIVGVPGRGMQLFGAITQIEGKTYVTYEGKQVPKVTVNEEDDIKSLALSSRGVPCPRFVDDWFTLKVK